MDLLSFPPEILDKICKELCNHCQTQHLSHIPHEQDLITSCPSKIWEHDAEGVKALVNLSKTCQTLNTLTLPHRYHRIELKRDIPDTREFIAQSRDSAHHVLKHVRSLSLAYTQAMTDCYNQLPDSQKHGPNFLCMVFHHAPKIQLLRINLNLDDQFNIPRRTTAESLRYLHIEYSDPESYCYLECFQIFYLLREAPKLDTLVIQVTSLFGWFPSLRLGNVKCLKLVDTMVSPKCLGKLLKSCPQLASFMFSFSANMRDWLEGGEDYMTTLQTLPQVLSVRQETLRHVELYWEPQTVNDDEMHIVGSFKALTNLERLALGGPGFRFEKAEEQQDARDMPCQSPATVNPQRQH